jgi:amino acid permease
MGEAGTGNTNRDNLTASQANSAYFSHTDGYDPLVYENTPQNWVKIVGMLILFYIFQGFHWWANFELGIHNSTSSTYYNLIIFASAVFIIGIMLILGARVNRLKLTHEFYMEKISEETQKQKDERAKAENKAAQEAKAAQTKL